MIILTCEEICGQRSYKERLHGVNVQGKEGDMIIEFIQKENKG